MNCYSSNMSMILTIIQHQSPELEPSGRNSPSGLGSMWKLFSDFVFSEYYGISDLHKPG